jgi:hypothetical protein
VIDVPDKGGEPARQPDDLAGLLPLDSYGGMSISVPSSTR